MQGADRGLRCAVLGSPIAHSLSPVLHRAAYAEIGWEGTYEAVELGAAGLPAFVSGRDHHWRGLSLTMPLKRSVVGLLDTLDSHARRAGAANTLVFDQGYRRGYNTDIPGAVAALHESGCQEAARVLILGGGATAASLGLAAALLGARHVTLAVRETSRSVATARVLSEEGLGVDIAELGDEVSVAGVSSQRWDLVVSTIPAAAQESLCQLAVPAHRLFEAIYDPWPTPLAEAAQLAGTTLITGLDLLAHQAVLQVELMTGSRPHVETLRAAGRAALGRG